MIDNWFPYAYKLSLKAGPSIMSWAVRLREHSESF